MTQATTIDHNVLNRALRLLGVSYRVVFDPSRNLEGKDYWVTRDNTPVATYGSLQEAAEAIGKILEPTAA